MAVHETEMQHRTPRVTTLATRGRQNRVSRGTGIYDGPTALKCVCVCGNLHYVPVKVARPAGNLHYVTVNVPPCR